MPAAAVIPAPLVYTNVAAVKKLVVGFRAWVRVLSLWLSGHLEGYAGIPGSAHMDLGLPRSHSFVAEAFPAQVAPRADPWALL